MRSGDGTRREQSREETRQAQSRAEKRRDQSRDESRAETRAEHRRDESREASRAKPAEFRAMNVMKARAGTAGEMRSLIGARHYARRSPCAQ